MTPEFWQLRWQTGRIGFNQDAPNPLLIKYFDALKLSVGSHVFVPFCGKSVDMIWLANQGFHVVGVELVEEAALAFFRENKLDFTVTPQLTHPSIRFYRSKINKQSITIITGDMFALTDKDLGEIDGVYDRAALIALPKEMREAYSAQVQALTQNAPQLIVTLNYDEEAWEGPPFSVTPKQILDYYQNSYVIKKIFNAPSILNAAPELAVSEQVWLLCPKPKADLK
ncbi:thiopurine S-methyltransferase [Psychrobacter ciconiae]|uniref:thiopurine S-methyltransferase n=1 Tax=Psychrobacter ciconiae TaxID=1553449 RepID=UPI00191A26E1|nr:thiopurine S-methyltransferase [Psychrobacter ciconiae]